ncbi:MAG: hypothetical protein A2Y18_05990 [Clostridiales bacterium GWD2_32_19]|nr:MAG: hypothetical protein A2Y18_05990 [Clostridiales bacterium GWD2_32_19]
MRILSSAVGLAILCVILVTDRQMLYFATAVVGVLGLKEFYDAMKQKSNPLSKTGLLFGAIYILLIGITNLYNTYSVILILIMFLTVFTVIIISYKEHNIMDAAITITGFFYVCVLLSYVPLVRNLEAGHLYIWLIFLVGWASDTGAYLIGFTLGKTKLCPDISPKKTVAGAVGGILFSIIFVQVYMIILIKYYHMNIDGYIGIALLIGTIGSIISQIGDLLASSIKRYVGIKDFGEMIPGHGGILDRFDSILFVAPFVYYVITMMML